MTQLYSRLNFLEYTYIGSDGHEVFHL